MKMEMGKFMTHFSRIHALYALGRFISPPVPHAAVAMQMPFVLMSLFYPRKWNLILALAANVLLVAMHLPAVVDMVRIHTIYIYIYIYIWSRLVRRKMKRWPQSLSLSLFLSVSLSRSCV